MRVVVFGRAAGSGVELLAAGLASLAVGLYPYGVFLLLARAYYALDDSRTPAFAAIASAVVGVVTMIGLAAVTHGTARVAALGIGHSVAYAVGALFLGIGLTRHIGPGMLPRHVVAITGYSCLLATLGWLAIASVRPADAARDARSARRARRPRRRGVRAARATMVATVERRCPHMTRPTFAGNGGFGRGRPLSVIVLLVVVALTTILDGGRAAHAGDPSSGPVSRVLILSMPGVSYRDLDLRELPHLRDLLAESALADLSARGVRRRPTLGDGYSTIGAGTRARRPRRRRRAVPARCRALRGRFGCRGHGPAHGLVDRAGSGVVDRVPGAARDRRPQ